MMVFTKKALVMSKWWTSIFHNSLLKSLELVELTTYKLVQKSGFLKKKNICVESNLHKNFVYYVKLATQNVG